MRFSFCRVPPDSAPGRLPPVRGVPELADQLVGAVQRGQPVGGGEVAQVLLDGEVVVEHRVLRAVAERPGQGDGAAVGGQGAGQDLQQGGLPGPVLADHRDELARADGQVHAPQHLVPAVGLAHVPGFQQRSGRGARPSPPGAVRALPG